MIDMTYGELVDSLRKDLQLDLSTDAVPHTGNDTPSGINVRGGWQLLAAYYVNNWITNPNAANPPTTASPFSVPMMFVDANGWVTLRGIMRNSAPYAYSTAPSTPLNLPVSLLPKGVELFSQEVADGSGNLATTNVVVFNLLTQAANPGLGGNVLLNAGTGTNTGTAAGLLNLSGIRWNYKS